MVVHKAHSAEGGSLRRALQAPRGRRSHRHTRALVVLASTLAAGSALPQWVTFVDETATRVSAPPAGVTEDIAEKSYAWGDLDRDGDVDLVIARKQPGTSTGQRRNVLLVNESGVLTDRTSEFAVASSVPGDMGFFTPTNDRDVVVVDVDLDGWLDVVTAVTLSQGEPQHIGYPRVYINQCCAVGGCAATSCTTGDWGGLRYEFDRIPAMLSDSGQAGFNPCFTAVAAGDVTGDGYPDLYFGGHDTGCSGPPAADFNDKLLVNQGASSPGYFTDVTEGSFTGTAADFPVTHYVGGVAIGKFNGDGLNDILRQDEAEVAIAYNDATSGFDASTKPYGGSSYSVSHGDLNNDDKLDIVVGDDGNDRYLLNQGDPGNGLASFLVFSYAFSHDGLGGPASDDGFAGNPTVADLDADGWDDVLIADVDIDTVSCAGRRTHIYHNLGGVAGGHVVLVEETTGAGCETSADNPPTCIVASIPADKLKGTHDIAVFDIDGDGRLDLVVGRCSGTEVYRNVTPPPATPSGAVPDGGRLPGPPLLLGRSGSTLTLSWGASCASTDTDYAVYAGTLGLFDSHEPLACSTGGATTLAVDLRDVDTPASYFLVGPRNEDVLGSLGTDSSGVPHDAGPAPCLPQVVASCE